MTNRVTDQTTQNGLIEKFRLKGLLPEMTVVPTIIPVVQVASLQDNLNISEFEKWRSVFSLGSPIIDPSDITLYSDFFSPVNTKVAPTSSILAQKSTAGGSGNTGCALPGGAVGVPATDGVYRISVQMTTEGGTIIQGNVLLTDQAAFGNPVALGTIRSVIGNFGSPRSEQGSSVCFDFYVIIRSTLQANAVVLDPSSGVNGNFYGAIYVQKLINEIPPNVIFP